MESAPDTSSSAQPKRGLFGRRARKKRPERPHPYRHEVSPENEGYWDPRIVTAIWLIGSALMAYLGWTAAINFGYVDNQFTAHPDVDWNAWTGGVLGVSLVLLAAGLWAPVDPASGHRLRMLGWIVFAAFWALTARDLFVREESDYVNSTAAVVVGVFGGTYIGYQEWLNIVRRSSDYATRFLGIVAVVAAGTYFAIARIAPIRIGLIEVVGAQTKKSLDLFGFGERLGLQFHIDKYDPWGPVLFHYPDTYCSPARSDPIGTYCGGLDAGNQTVTMYGGGFEGAVNQTIEPSGFWEDILLYTDDNLRIIPVSIILACTAIQSIMLFVGLILGTKADLRSKLLWSLGIGGTIYVLNLLRNTLVIWAYGRGHASFFFIHNVAAKILTLGALVGIALVMFKRFPAFLDSLGAVLDMPHRDGPIERTLRFGRRRPDAAEAIIADDSS